MQVLQHCRIKMITVASQYKDYIRLSRFHAPVGALLLMLPCWWGLALIRPLPSLESIPYMFLLAIGAYIMRGAGCVVNDLLDWRFDSQVERTKDRPIASGRISRLQGVIFFGILCLGGLVVFLQIPFQAQGASLIGLGLLILYPLMKRFTYWPQVFLGLTFNIGVFVGYGCFAEIIPYKVYALYLAGIFWTLAYDTIYAYQDKKYDELIGLKSTAVRFGNNGKYLIILFYLAMIAILVSFGMCHSYGIFYWVMLGGAVISILYILSQFDDNNTKKCMTLFIQNVYVGLWIFLALWLGRL